MKLTLLGAIILIKGKHLGCVWRYNVVEGVATSQHTTACGDENGRRFSITKDISFWQKVEKEGWF